MFGSFGGIKDVADVGDQVFVLVGASREGKHRVQRGQGFDSGGGVHWEAPRGGNA
jgi:hypothetical protein